LRKQAGALGAPFRILVFFNLFFLSKILLLSEKLWLQIFLEYKTSGYGALNPNSYLNVSVWGALLRGFFKGFLESPEKFKKAQR